MKYTKLPFWRYSGALLILSFLLPACLLQEQGGILLPFEQSRQQLHLAVQSAQAQNQGFRLNLLEKIEPTPPQAAPEPVEGWPENPPTDTLDARPEQVLPVSASEYEYLAEPIHRVQQLTAQVLAQLRVHENKLFALAEFDEHTLQFANPGETRSSTAYWLKEGNAESLLSFLEDYQEALRQLSSNLQDQAVAATSVIVPFRTETDIAQWSENHFSGPVISQLASLEGLKLIVLRQEWDMLNYFNSHLGVASFRPNTPMVLDNPTSRSVIAGETYSTQLSLGMTSNELETTFSSPSGTIHPGDEPATAYLNVPANGSVIPEGKSEGRQAYSAQVRVRLPNGRYQEIPVQGAFTVRKPELIIRSERNQFLYAICGNDLFFDVPALGEQYDPVITATEAEVIPSKKFPTKFRIVPTGKTCTLTIASTITGQKVRVGDIAYRVVSPPRPRLELAINGQLSDGRTPLSKSSRVQIRLAPDPDFLALFPEDARYEIGQVEVWMQSGSGEAKRVNSLSFQGEDATKGQTISLGTEIRQAPAGTKVILQLQEVYRKNFANKRVPVDLSLVERTLAFTVK